MFRREGDSHRFGQRVEELALAGGTRFFNKPRSVLLEKLFLDPSYCPAWVRRHLPYNPAIAVASRSPWDGQVQALDTQDWSISDLRKCPQYARRAGALIAICTFLGITDLHFQNVLPQLETDGTWAPVPIDIECVFWDCVSAIDTNLISSPFTLPHETGLSVGSGEAYFPERPSLLLDGYLEASSHLLPVLEEVLVGIEREMGEHPIRVILRPTQDYRRLMTSTDPLRDALEDQSLARKGWGLIPEELVQLRAGDIPYFFVQRTASPRLLWFESPGGITEATPRHFEKVLKSATPSVAELTLRERTKRLRTISALHIVKAFHSNWPASEMYGARFELQRDGASFALLTSDFQAQARFF